VKKRSLRSVSGELFTEKQFSPVAGLSLLDIAGTKL
jgi:hypothetical protein